MTRTLVFVSGCSCILYWGMSRANPIPYLLALIVLGLIAGYLIPTRR